MKTQILSFFILLLLANLNLLSAQKTADAYWTAFGVAMGHYDNADYEKAAEAFELVWQMENEKELANHRLYAAAANCMIDNEEKVKANLFKIVAVASKDDRKRVLVNYQIFDKYKNQAWWTELETKLDERLESLIAHHKNLKIFKKGRNFKYSAIRINKNGDTLANTFVTMMPDGTGWGDEAANSQSQVIYKYDYTRQDSLDHILELDTTVHRRFWNGIDTTGIIERAHLVWIHPIRNNEFFKTEIAPFPTVLLPISASSMQDHHPKTVIMNNWGSYNNTETNESYTYLGEVTRPYSFNEKLSCHKFKGEGDNSRHGLSYLEYFFNEEFGFVEMNYKTYDGDRIDFKMIEIIE